MVQVLDSLETRSLTDPVRLEGTDIFLQKTMYNNVEVLDIRKRKHGEGVMYHVLHHTRQGVTLRMSTVRNKLIILLPKVREMIREISETKATLQIVKCVLLRMVTDGRIRSWCDGCEIDDPSQHHHDCIMLGPDLFNPLFNSWSEWIVFTVTMKMEKINTDELIQITQKYIPSSSAELIKECVEFLNKHVRNFAMETEEFLTKKDSYILPGEVVHCDKSDSKMCNCVNCLKL